MIKKIDRQLGGFALGAALPFLAALIVTPLIARNLSDKALLLAGASLVAHAMFGLFDIFRPILIRQFVSLQGQIALLPTMLRPALVALPLGACVIAAILVFLPDLGAAFALAAGLSLVAFLLGTPFWARLDAARMTGLAYLLRTSGILILYLMLASTPFLLPETAVPWFILIANLVATTALFLAARGLFSRSGDRVVMPVRDMVFVLGQNLLKSFGDYADRIAILGTGNAALAGQYNLLADLPLKSNMPSQIAASYTYPRLCESDAWLTRYVTFGVLFSFALSSASLLFFLFGKPVYIAYYGARFEELFPAFCLLLTVAATYTLSFYGQAFLRSRSLDVQLLFSFGLPAVAGAIYLATNSLNLVSVLTALIIFRTCSLMMTLFALRAGALIFLTFLPAYGYALAISLYLLSIFTS